jgi:hypothetical protein
MAGVGQEEQITGFEFLGGVEDGVLRRLGLGRLGQNECAGLEFLFLRQGLHVPGVRLAGGELAVPSFILIGIDAVKTDVDRDALRHNYLPFLGVFLWVGRNVFAFRDVSFSLRRSDRQA